MITVAGRNKNMYSWELKSMKLLEGPSFERLKQKIVTYCGLDGQVLYARDMVLGTGGVPKMPSAGIVQQPGAQFGYPFCVGLHPCELGRERAVPVCISDIPDQRSQIVSVGGVSKLFENDRGCRMFILDTQAPFDMLAHPVA